MNYKTETTFLLMALLAMCLFVFAPADADAQKNSDDLNFIVIFTDDQGYGDLSCYGHPTIKTPHIDKMASEGKRRTSFYAPAV